MRKGYLFRVCCLQKILCQDTPTAQNRTATCTQTNTATAVMSPSSFSFLTVVDQHPERVDIPGGGRRNQRGAVHNVARLHVRSVRDQALQSPRHGRYGWLKKKSKEGYVQ